MRGKILFVDDDDVFRHEFKDALSGYTVLEASSGSQALAILRKANSIDLVILDVMMPGLNGIEVLKEIKKISENVGIIILTGYSSEDIAIEALKNHADDYLEKPLEVEKALESIDRIIQLKSAKNDMSLSGIEEKIEKVKRFAERNWSKKVSLNDAALEVCLSPKYLSRVFHQITGVTFNEYKLKLKVEKAKELLLKTGGNINQIADKLGYANAESFIRLFEKYMGLSPLRFRKTAKLKKTKR